MTDDDWRGKVGVMEQDEIAIFLEEPNIARLAPVDAEGWPYVVPVWQEWTDAKFWVVPREKWRLLRHDWNTTNRLSASFGVARRAEVLSAAAQHGASNLRVYGSVVSGEASPQSDIDLLVDVEDRTSLLDLAALHLELEDLLGFPVEIGTDVKPRLRETVHSEAITR